MVAAAAATLVVVVRRRLGRGQLSPQDHCVAALDALVVALDRLRGGEAPPLVPLDRLLVARLHV